MLVSCYRAGTLSVRSGSSTHLSAAIASAAAGATILKQRQPAAAARQSSANSLLALTSRPAGGSAAARMLAQIDAAAADASGYLLHPAVGDNCIHIAAAPGKASACF